MIAVREQPRRHAGPAHLGLIEGALIKNPDERFPSATVMSALDDAFLSIDHVRRNHKAVRAHVYSRVRHGEDDD